MVPVDTLTTVVSGFVAVVTATITVLAWRQRPNPGATTLATLMACITCWNVSLLATTPDLGYQWARQTTNLVVLFSALTPATFFAFALEYTGRERLLTWPFPLALGVEPILTGVLTFTNDRHHLYWEGVYIDPTTMSGIDFVEGVGSISHLVYAYALVTIGTLLILQRLYRSNAVHRRQTVAILAGVLATWLGNALFVLNISEFAHILGFAVAGIVVFMAVTEFRLVDLTPVARTTVLDALEAGVVVVDDAGRVTDINPYARELLAVESDDAVLGLPATAVFGDWPPLTAWLESHDAATASTTVELDRADRIVDVKSTPLVDDLGRSVGRLLLFEDVTDREQRRQEIEDQNERLESFATMVSHDLRNPLDVASGHVELLRADAESTGGPDDPHVDGAADALERIESIVEDVLTLAREGEHSTNPTAVSLRIAARTAWDHVETGQAQLLVGTDAMIVADRPQLERLFENLFRNAIEHGSPTADSNGRREQASSVSISVSTIPGDDGFHGFYVEDDGPGIPPTMRAAVFNSGVSGHQHGTGFGLAIVQQLASAHDWEITLTDGSDGGARFEFSDVTFASESVPPGSASDTQV